MAEIEDEESKKDRFMCLQCHLVKFTDSVDVANAVSANLSVEGLLSLSKNDGSTSIFCLKQGRVVTVSAGSTDLELCKRVFWDQWGQSPDDGALLYTQDSTGTILELTVAAQGVTLQGQLLLEPLQKAIEGYCKTAVSSVELVGYDKGHLLLLVNTDTLCAAEIRDNVCLPCCWLPLPSQGPQALTFTFQVAAGMVGVVHSQAQLLIIYHLSDGQLVCQIDLEPAGFNQPPTEGETETSEGERERGERERGERERSEGESETRVPQREKTTTEGERRLTAASSVIPWSLSPALDRLVWLDSQGALVSLHLETYIRRHPHVLRLPERNPPPSSRTRVTHTVQSCRLGGKSSWREKLVQGHLRQGSGSSLWSSAKLALTLADLKRADGRGVAASAFRKQGEEEGVGEGYRECVRLPEGYPLELGYAVREMQCCGVVVTMVMEDGANRTRAVGMVNVVTGEVYFRSIPSDHCLIATPTGSLPIMLLSPGGVLLLAPTGDTHHEDIVSKLMQHSGAPRTDSVCQLNGWSHSTVPLTALEQGLRQHQLDTVAFFLASQQHIFSGHGRNTAPSTPSQTWTEGAHLSAMRQLSPALDLFLKVIHGDLADMSPPQEFGERLLSQTLEFLFDLLKDGSVRHGQLTRKDAHRAESLDLDCALEVAMGYIGRLRAAQSADQSQKRRAALRPSTSVLADKESLDAVNVDTVDADPGEVTVYTEGLDVCGTIWRLSQYTTDREFQLFVVHQLHTASTLGSQDQRLVEDLQKLYSAYPAASVHHGNCGDLCPSRGPWSHSALTGQTRTVSTRISSEVKDIASTTPAPAEGPYCVVALHWLRQMEEEMKEALLLDGAVLRKEATEERGFTPRLLWRYWLGRNQPGPAIRALEVAMATERGMLGTLLDQYLRDLRLASALTQHQVQTHLLRKRVYRWEILHSLDAAPEDQLRLLEGLLHTPHPLHGYAHAVLRCFHRQFAAYCAQHGLVLALWQYCSLHGVDVEALRDLPCAEDVPWFKSFLCLHSAVNQPNNLEAMCGGSLLLASVRWTPDDWTLSTLLAQGHVTTATATVAYLPHTCALTQAGETPQYHVDVPTLHSGLQRFPKLLSALLPPDADTSRFDINVYQLLRDNCPLHSTRLFGWQSTNTAAAEDSVKVLPYFSQPDLVGRFAHGTKLNLTYYLKHGRPTYALLSFLAEELEHKTSTLSPKRVAGACGVALWLCVKHFHRAPVSGACVALVEMLGRDSTLLRTYLQAGEAILTHRTRRLSAPVERRKEMVKACEQDVVTLLQSCLGNRQRDGRRLLSALEDAITDEIAREGLSCTSVEAALKWNVAMLLCHHLRLPLSSRFLENAAHDDKWLPFLWFAQLHQFPKAQLQQVVHHFSARHLRDHLHYIITNAGANTVTTATPTSEARPPGPKATTNTTADGSRQIRSALYSKIGLHAPDDADEESSEEGVEEEEEEEDGGRGRRDSADPLKSSSRRSSEDDIEVREESTASDVFRVVFSALATGQPWRSLLMHAVVLRNPLFAELAGCCGAPMVSSLCAWLVAMLSPTEHARFVEHDGKRAWRWSEKHLERLMETYLRCHAENTLTAAFFIFQPTSPLLPFLQFIRECVFWRNYEGCKAFLDNFKDAMSAISAGTSKPSREKGSGGVNKGEQSGVSVVGDRDWLERVAYRVVHHQLVHAPSLHDAWRMLGLLAEENIALVFSFDVLDFGHLHKMLGVLHRCQVGEGLHLPHLLADQGLHLPHLLADQGPHQHLRLAQCGRALQSLVAQGYQEDAYLFGQLAGLDLSGVVLKQMSSEKQQLQGSGVWGSGVIRRRYWTQCAATCHRFHLPAATVAHFFQSEAEDRESLREKTSLYKLSLTHVEGVLGREVTGSDDLRTLRDRTFTALWRCTVQDRVARHRTVQQLGSDKEGEGGDMFSDSEEGGSVSRSLGGREELLHTALHPQAKVRPEDELNSEEAMELESMMGDLLAEGHVTQCCDLATLLGGHCEDLTIVLTCIGLSTGEITVATMDAASRLLLTTAERRKSLSSLVTIAPSPSSVSLASAAPNWGFLPPGQEEIIFTLEQLLSRCHKCRPCCLRIISVYKIACLIGRSYQEVVMAEEFSILRELLKTEFPPRYALAAEFLSTSSLSDHEVAAFLVEEIVKSLRIYLGGKDGFEGESSSGRSGELIFRPTEGGQVFSQLVSLCADPAVLGHRLLQALATMADQSEQPTQEVLSMESELLIMAHECHTAACNMEGISNVLRAARVCAQCLAGASQYHLMMRLLTGIGRYSEMTYIFDYLQQHHQFEMLLRKGIDKEDKLKTAILDYLKRFHSDDKDTYSMVALNFSMYREIADMLDESGHRNLALLRDKPLDSNRETQDTLKKCIQYFGDAAESYAKDKCYMNTQKCLRWARLVNLQLHLLGSGVKVINLTPEEVKAFVASHPSFLEAYVVTEAYGRAVDWSDSLFNHVLMSADMRYLQDFRTYVKLTPSLIENTLYKLRHSPGKLTSCVGVVRKMLKLCPDVWLQYSIARDLGLQDVTRDLLRNDTCSSYLKDLISQQ